MFRTLHLRAWIGLLAWGLCLSMGITLELRHELTAAAQSSPLARWPAVAGGLLSTELASPQIDAPNPRTGPPSLERRPVVLIFLHPHCPCSNASLAEVLRVVGESPRDPLAFAVFVKPEGTPTHWEESNLWMSACRNPRLTVITDQNGRIAQLFRATHSGQVLVYDHDRLIFHGGVTAGRGRLGPGASSRLLARQLEDPAGTRGTPVFGCPLARAQDTAGATP